jgi:eukaryotic-like serine/threonine-protein kinase
MLAAGTKLRHYRILSHLGAGGMGEVYLAEDTKLNRRVAIKVLSPNSIDSENANRRLLREAQSAAKLDHPNICGILEVSEADGRNFICMQYVEGETLGAKMRRHALELPEVLAIATQVADALVEAHARDIVHRDIKPSNIMVTARGAVKVMDFGLAKQIKQSDVVKLDAETEAFLSAAGALIGTLPYMSPEQVRSEALDGRSDIFSFGVVLYEMVSGLQPFASKSTGATASAILTLEPAPLARFSHNAPAELERIVSKALRKNPDDRYQTAKDLLIDVRSLRDEREFQHRLERSAAPNSKEYGSAQEVPVTSDSVPTRILTAEQQANETVIDVQKTTAAATSTSSIARLGKTARSRTGLIVLSALILAAAAGWFIWHRTSVKWAEAQVPKIEALAQAQKFYEAYELAVPAQKYLPQDATITRLMPIISNTISVKTDPAGAQVYLRRFVPDDAGKSASRQLVGTTPLENLRVARAQYILYIEKDGYAKTERTVSGAIQHLGTLMMMPPPILVEQKLIAADQMPQRMTFVSGGDYRMVAWNRPTEARARLDDYFIDKYEVSNQEYKEFINAGGYLKKEFWKYPLSKDGRTLSWDEAMKEFRDRTGLPGPRSWSSQNFPEGKADHPVTDISWYEAAAYAAFRGKQLPTIFQWEKAARNGRVSGFGTYMPWGIFFAGETLDHHANFKNEGTMPVTSSEFGISPFGAYNMAGNASEWCLNETSEGFIATGGAWGSPEYTFARFGTLPGFYSSNKVGFRCALNSSAAAGDQGGMRIEIKNEVPVYAPSSDADFNKWLTHYEYDKKPLDPQIVEAQETAEWRRERITFNGADGERAIAYLYLPKNFPRPLQVIHFVPHSTVGEGLTPLPDTIESYLAPFIKSGRAVFGVVLKGYSERLRPDNDVSPEPTTVEYRDRIVNWITDLRRGLDYLETRNDLDAGRIACYTLSSGGRTGLILTAVENRYRSIFMAAGGVRKASAQWVPETNPINFASHIRAPKLIMHGRYDEVLTWKVEAEPLYKLLPEPKRLVLYDAGHGPPFEFFVTTMNGWLDETLGPVGRE